jgi:hypothetical protein
VIIINNRFYYFNGPLYGEINFLRTEVIPELKKYGVFEGYKQEYEKCLKKLNDAETPEDVADAIKLLGIEKKTKEEYNKHILERKLEKY